jgi:hypothetical protein
MSENVKQLISAIDLSTYIVSYSVTIQGLVAGQWFSSGAPVSSTNKTDCHDITEILLKVALNTITLTPNNKCTWLNCN